MRKLTASLILVSLPVFGMACSQHADRTPVELNRPEPTSVEGGMGKTAAEQQTRPKKTYFAAEPGNQGVVESAYTNEKQAMNYKIADQGVRSRPTDRMESDGERPVVEDTSKFKAAMQEPLSTFSADVDTASYSNVRREILQGKRPAPTLVRVEEMLNYFNYDLAEPKGKEPFSVITEVSDCPWDEESRLMRVAIKTKSLDRGESPPRNLVFLLDVSGSMNFPDKLPLLKQSLRLLVDNLDDEDRVAIVVYAGDSGIALPSTTGDKKTTILESIEQLRAGGSTNGASGIELAYQVAEQNKSKNSVNRVILATDGDFNVGISSQEELKTFIEQKRKSGLFLSVLGFGQYGNDALMETLADNGNGNYASIDNLNEAKKVLVKEAGATLVTVAKDVKFQVDFDPKMVESYRLIGYKNRRLAAQDFDNDSKDAGELGAGHSVTALYEIRMAKSSFETGILTSTGLAKVPDLAKVKLRYKAPEASKSELMVVPVNQRLKDLNEASPDQQWATAVVGFGMVLSGDLESEKLPLSKIASLLQPSIDQKPDAYQLEFYELVKKSAGFF